MSSASNLVHKRRAKSEKVEEGNAHDKNTNGKQEIKKRERTSTIQERFSEKNAK